MTIQERQLAKPERLATKASKDGTVLSEVVKGVSSDKAKIKYCCAKVLRILSQTDPEILYPKWNSIVDMLDFENTFLRANAVLVIANLTKVDSRNRFEKLFNRYYELMNDKSMITTGNLVGMSGVIVAAKPELETKITNKLLSIDRTHHGSECQNVIKANAIKAFDEYFGESRSRKKILDFVRGELKNTRPSTRRRAEDFLKKWDS